MEYEKEDLVWEATRRSELYKTIYNEEFAKNSSSYRLMVCHRILRTNLLLDPSIKIDEIKKKIKLGADPADVHPYHGYFETRQKPAIRHAIPGVPFDGWERVRATEPEKSQDRFDKYLKLNEEFFYDTCTRVIISIDPLARDEDIFNEIKKIKNDVLENRRTASVVQLMNTQNVDGSDDDDDILPKKTYAPGKIASYIGWLEKYDQIVEKIKEIEGEENLVKYEGIVKIPKGFSFSRMVSDCPQEKHEGQRKAYKKAYEDSVEIIKNHLDLPFSKARIDK
jgi:hypothetical protein